MRSKSRIRLMRIYSLIAGATLIVLVAASVRAGSVDAAKSVSAANSPNAQTASKLTWSKDVAPILYHNCTTCHHPGGAGPFSLLTYGDAKRWGAQVVRVTQSRYMPPWLPEPDHGDFADNR